MSQVLEVSEERRKVWLARVGALLDQIESWCHAERWKVEREEKILCEEHLGQYSTSSLHITLPEGELLVNPIALQVIGGEGRVDLEAYPTLCRVKLLGEANGWIIMTDSNVPVRLPWDRGTFRQLVRDLLS